MNIHPIHTEEDYRAALKSVSALFENEPEIGTPEGDYFDIMITLIESYESKHFPSTYPILSMRSNSEWSSPGCPPPILHPPSAAQIVFMKYSMASER